MQVKHTFRGNCGELNIEYPAHGEYYKEVEDVQQTNGDKKTKVPTVYYQNHSQSTAPLTTAIICQFLYSLTSLLLAFSCIVIGATLALNSISADTKWTIDIIGFKSELNSTSQGVVIAIIGLVISWFGKFEVSLNENVSNQSIKQDK
jgi:hypothetical protein